jgi:uncharacterized protein
MKVSQYTFFVKSQNTYCLYNTVSNRLISIGKILYEKLEKHSINKTNLPASFLKDEELINELKTGFFITENDTDALLWIKNIVWANRGNQDIHNITIAPTMNCNFSCFYCFEKHRKGMMKSDVMDGIINYINRQKNLKFLNLTWFGGEPLLAYQKMKQIMERLVLPKGSKISSLLITNGYYLSPKIVDELDGLKINRIQLSIDGIYEQYNDVKFMPKDKKCFEKVLRNIDYFSKKSNIPLYIRINISKDNYSRFLDIFNFFKERYPNKPIFVVPAFLKSINNESNCKSNCYVSKKEIMDFNTYAYQNLKDISFIYPSDNLNECAIRNQNTLAFAPDGAVYKCWEVIGEKENAVGHIEKDGTITISNPILLNRYCYGSDPLSDDTCQKCSIYPICIGGCPQQRIRKEFYGMEEDLCSNFKESLITNLEQRITNFKK